MSIKKIAFVLFSVVMIVVMVAAVAMFLELPTLARALLGTAVTATVLSSLLHYHEREQKKQTTPVKPNSNTKACTIKGTSLT